MPRHQAIDVGSGRICLEWVAPTVAIVRAFPGLVGEIDPATGQPFREWIWSCVAEVHERTMHIHAVMNAPRYPTVGELRGAAASLGMERLEWERWVNGRKYPGGCPLPPRSWPVLTYPG